MIEFARTKLEFDDLAYEVLLNNRVRIQPAPDLEVYFLAEVSFRSTVSPTIKSQTLSLKKSTRARPTESGASRCGKCPIPSITTRS